MDWKECIWRRIVKNVKVDINLINSVRKIAEAKIESAEFLREEMFIGKISLLYDALREYLESLALEKGYKIYNHECYAPFLKEILGKDREAEEFDKLRKIRNAINYYGMEIEKDEGEKIIKELLHLIKKIKTLLNLKNGC